MSRHPQLGESRGSLRWIKDFVNERSTDLNEAINNASGGRVQTPITWHSPLEGDDYAEYRDESFLEVLGVEPSERPLHDFWPRQGPQWDALGTDASGASILVEAKANIPEIITSPTGAGPSSRSQIEGALEEVTAHLGVESTCDWTGTFYQYANRLAHLYFLSVVNDLDAWLVFVYFTGDSDVDGPETRQEWEAALQVLEGPLGLGHHPLLKRKINIFPEVGR